MAIHDDPLVPAMSRLEGVLSQTNLENAVRTTTVEAALAGIEKAIAEHADLLGKVGEPIVDLDRPLVTSPGADRQKAALRDELAGLLREARALRHTLQEPMPRQPMLAPEAVCLSGSRPTLAADVKHLQDALHRLVAEIKEFKHEEVSFVQDSIVTDIGAGD